MADYEQGADPNAKPNPLDEIKDGEMEVAGWAQLPEDEQAKNLVPFFHQSSEGREWLKKLAENVCTDFKRGWDSCREYRKKRRKNFRMLTGDLPPKDWPFANCANAHTPLMLEHVLRLQANMYAEIFTDRELIFSVDATGPDDQEEAEILTLHGNWQLRNQLTDFLAQMDLALMEFVTAGSVFCHSWRDTRNGRNRHDVMTCSEFVFPYVDKTVEIDLRDVPWKARVIKRYRNEVMDLRDMGEWDQLDEVLKENPPPWNDDDDDDVRQAGAKQEGIRAPENDPTAPYVFYEYHGYARMPGENYQRPIVAIVEKQRKIVVRLYIREEDDPDEKMVYERKLQQIQDFQNDTAAFPQAQANYEAQMAMGPQMDPMGQPLPPPEPPQPPVPQPWMEPDELGGIKPPEPPRKRAIEVFTHGRCIVNPAGALGLSFGSILGDLNRLADEAYNRELDAGTLANVQTWLKRRGVNLGASSSIAIQPGRFIDVDAPGGGKLADDIMDLRANPPTGTMMNIVATAKQDASAAVAAPGVLSGEPGKSGETFRGISTRREQATKQLSASGIKFIQFLNQIVKNNAKLNAMFMPDEEIIQVGNHFASVREKTREPETVMPDGTKVPGAPKPQIVVGAAMYRRSYNVTFTADARFASEAQRIAEADECVGILTQVPPLQGMPALVYDIVAEAFRARGKTNLVAAMGPRPPVPDIPMGTPPPPPPPGQVPPEEGAPPQ